jgi:hypothetical protein
MTTTPRVDALIERVMDEHPSVGRAARAAYYEAVHQELAPLARDLELESALLRNDIARLRKVVMAAEAMRYSNTAAAVHAFDAALAAWEDER